jgi:sugar lactone lactonase YvrE
MARPIFVASVLVLAAAPLVAGACGGETPTATTPTTSATAAPSAAPSAAPDPSASAAASAAVPPPPAGPKPLFHIAGFQTPESVLFDEAGDRYLVSNINGKPTDADNNGYISEVSPDGKITKEKFIAAGQNKVTLNAPKGTAIAAGVLWVADLDTVRSFDAKTGAHKSDIKIPGATFLNDVAAAPDGKIYVSDTGMKASASGFEPTGTDAVWVIEKGKAKPLAKDKNLERPNGVLAADKGVWVVTFGAADLYRLDDKGQKQDVTKLPKGMLDGIFKNGDDVYVSSWEASAVYKGKPGGTFEVVIPNVKSPADIGLDKKRGRILVPLFMENAVEIYEIPK